MDGKLWPHWNLEASPDFMLPEEAFLVIQDCLQEHKIAAFEPWQVDLSVEWVKVK